MPSTALTVRELMERWNTAPRALPGMGAMNDEGKAAVGGASGSTGERASAAETAALGRGDLSPLPKGKGGLELSPVRRK